MNLKKTIKIALQEQIKVSTLFKRKLHIVDKVIDKLIEGMYPCDYDSADEFLHGVIYEMGWLVRNDDFGLDDVDWLDIYDYIMVFKDNNTGKGKKDEILEYYTERCL
jgi:hypothetical protein